MGKMQLSGKTALVTGAASGIGRATALSLAKRNCNLILADINEAGLTETVKLLAPHSVSVSTHSLDVSDKQAVMRFPDHVQQLDILINNAGVGISGNFEQLNPEEFDWLFNINFHAVVNMCRAFLPLLKESADARIVNISSVYGLFGVPGNVAYCASKFAVRGFSEALRYEIADNNIGVSVVHPGGVATSIAKNARIAESLNMSEEDIEREKANADRLLTLDPSIAGETIVKGIENRKDRILVGDDAKAVSLIVRLFPVSYWNILQRFVED